MPIPTILLDRIRTSAMSGDHVATALAQLAGVADETGAEDCAINLEFVLDGDDLKPGDLIPVISLAIARIPART